MIATKFPIMGFSSHNDVHRQVSAGSSGTAEKDTPVNNAVCTDTVDRLSRTVTYGSLSSVPLIGFGLNRNLALELQAIGDQKGAAIGESASWANIGGTLSLGVGLIAGGTALSAGVAGLGLGALLGAYGYYRLAKQLNS